MVRILVAALSRFLLRSTAESRADVLGSECPYEKLGTAWSCLSEPRGPRRDDRELRRGGRDR